ncbi:MAG: hypothetical protein J6K86_04955 [Clostridia bacterium]|nr:hypothetical protein [Clostridia bacterium]
MPQRGVFVLADKRDYAYGVAIFTVGKRYYAYGIAICLPAANVAVEFQFFHQ